MGGTSDFLGETRGLGEIILVVFVLAILIYLYEYRVFEKVSTPVGDINVEYVNVCKPQDGSPIKIVLNNTHIVG